MSFLAPLSRLARLTPLSRLSRIARPSRLIAAGTALAVCAGAAFAFHARSAQAEKGRWWKGNLHTHSLWSDGDDYPEMIADWYHRNGYDFLALSDHNILSQGENWIDAEQNRGGKVALDKYRTRFGDWVEERVEAGEGGKRMVRLKPLEEFRHLFEEPGKFLMIQSEEISDRFERKPIHINATNLRELIPPQGGDSVVAVMQNNVDAVLEQRRRTGQPMFPHLNHPNFGWAITAEELLEVKGEKFFEVYNGHPSVHNYGDEHRSGTEQMWDVILTRRIAERDGEIMFGIAVDDAHNYHGDALNRSNPGRGWVMVRAPRLTPEQIVLAMEAGDFYASTGVILRDVQARNGSLSVEVQPDPGVEYTIRFIGTREGFDPRSEMVPLEGDSMIRASRRYSADVGAVLAEHRGPSATYRLQGNELYVRAKVISTRPQRNPYREGDTEVAWVQPLIPARRR
jgi:hypothetical protein